MSRGRHSTPLGAVEASLWVLAAGAGSAVVWTSIHPNAVHMAGLQWDRLTTTLATLVAIVGAVTFRFARNYLLGEIGQTRFLAWHAIAVVSAMVLMLSSNLILLWAAWTMTGYALHRLLTHYTHRAEAWPPARKKFLISRLGDMALLPAICVIAFAYGTTDLHTFLRLADASDAATQAVAIMVVIAALTKSAQFPFHSWLPETMESPTPVSALMHAGIINAGGAVLLKFAPILLYSPAAMLLLVIVGTFTASLGMLSLWAQTNVKRTLAWSTISQMGFMMIQIGLACFPAALLHIIGHGCYKAWSFLASGTLPEANRSSRLPPTTHLGWVGVGSILAGGSVALWAWAFGLHALHNPGELALLAVLSLAIGQVWPTVMGRVSIARALGALGVTLIASLIAIALYRGAIDFYAPVFAGSPNITTPLTWAMASGVVIAMAGSIVVHAFLPVLSQSTRGRALRVHALHGFYCGAVADRIVRTVWTRFSTTGEKIHA